MMHDVGHGQRWYIMYLEEMNVFNPHACMHAYCTPMRFKRISTSSSSSTVAVVVTRHPYINIASG